MGFQESFNERVTASADRAFGVTATLAHGPAVTEPFTATWETIHYEVETSEGFSTRFTSRDFMFPVAAAAIAGQAFEPRAGDRISTTENGTPVVFELLSMANVPAVELMAGGFRWKVHTKKVG